jgi:hypothetical protein
MYMAQALEPANSIIARLGGLAVVQSITGASRTRVYRWTQPKDNGGTGGLIPVNHAPKLLSYAKLHGVPLSEKDFIPLGEDVAA